MILLVIYQIKDYYIYNIMDNKLGQPKLQVNYKRKKINYGKLEQKQKSKLIIFFLLLFMFSKIMYNLINGVSK
jgi:hypothetical protein